MLLIELFAEREGFEPPVPLGTAVFKTAVIDHSTISPMLSSLLAGRCALKASAKVLSFFGSAKLLQVFFSNYFRFPYPYAGKVVTLQYDLP